jgi:hypothetical protein
MIDLNLNYFGGRDYIDIAQIGYRCMYPFFKDDYSQCNGFYIRIQKAVTPYAVLIAKEDYENKKLESNYEIAARVRIGQIGKPIYEGYVCNPLDKSGFRAKPIDISFTEPTYIEGQHYLVLENEVRVIKPIETQWPAPFSLMMMARLCGQHFYHSQKPRGVMWDAKRIPTQAELTQLRATTTSKPIHGLVKINTYIGDELFGSGLLKI